MLLAVMRKQASLPVLSTDLVGSMRASLGSSIGRALTNHGSEGMLTFFKVRHAHPPVSVVDMTMLRGEMMLNVKPVWAGGST